MKTNYLLLTLFVSLFMTSCAQKNIQKSIRVTNNLSTERSFETIELTTAFLKVDSLNSLGVKDALTGELKITQLVDTNGDGIYDQLLFQPTVAANASKEYQIVVISKEEQPKSIEYCYSRFVPERTDDYTWENNKVAFRMYGPTAQKMIEDNVKGGTLSSGVDAWLKKVDYPIINKWYKKTVIDKTGSYHEDTGEGLDNFHVGTSRGVGGIAVKKDSTFYISKNYTEWKTITTGPLRTSFQLNFADWDADDTTIKESKIITLDYGNNLSKFEVSVEGTDEISAGLTLHEKLGEVFGNQEKGWVAYWEPIGDTEIGTAIVAATETFKSFEKYDTKTADLSNAFAHLKVTNNNVVYYAGFGWKKAKEFTTKEAWETYLNSFSEKINNPLLVELIE